MQESGFYSFQTTERESKEEQKAGQKSISAKKKKKNTARQVLPSPNEYS